MDDSSDSGAVVRVSARYFDGRSTRPHKVQVWLAQGQLQIDGETVRTQVPAAQVQWPERTRHGPRVARLPDGASLQSLDADAWDAWRRDTGHVDGWVVALQQSWRAVAASVLALVLLLAAGYVWGLPWLAREVAQRVPDGLEDQVGEAVLAQLDDMVKPSRLSADEQRAIEAAWAEVLQRHQKAQAAQGRAVRPTQLLIRESEIGPNALALPGGTILLTDDMVRLVQNDTRVLSGVLAHELGHVQHRHGLQTLVQIGVLGAATSLVWGDFSGLLATVPLWLGQAHYSRQAEREADAHSVGVLRDAGISPQVMVTLLDRFALYRRCGDALLKPAAAGEAEKPQGARQCAGQAGKGTGKDDKADAAWGLGFASHPADAERIAFFNAAAR
ncbi:M48 family metallopeptidase [Hydrogenophaga sp. MI9]|uniref:M48 family metallopeptidase n=1 Tax=Hydrogenophaga sp. MI9 TaxID=3453719 RepID=UPI003EEE4896